MYALGFIAPRHLLPIPLARHCNLCLTFRGHYATLLLFSFQSLRKSFSLLRDISTSHIQLFVDRAGYGGSLVSATPQKTNFDFHLYASSKMMNDALIYQ
jgi:hypothetical protein